MVDARKISVLLLLSLAAPAGCCRLLLPLMRVVWEMMCCLVVLILLRRIEVSFRVTESELALRIFGRCFLAENDLRMVLLVGETPLDVIGGVLLIVVSIGSTPKIAVLLKLVFFSMWCALLFTGSCSRIC